MLSANVSAWHIASTDNCHEYDYTQITKFCWQSHLKYVLKLLQSHGFQVQLDCMIF